MASLVTSLQGDSWHSLFSGLHILVESFSTWCQDCSGWSATYSTSDSIYLSRLELYKRWQLLPWVFTLSLALGFLALEKVRCLIESFLYDKKWKYPSNIHRGNVTSNNHMYDLESKSFSQMESWDDCDCTWLKFNRLGDRTVGLSFLQVPDPLEGYVR